MNSFSKMFFFNYSGNRGQEPANCTICMNALQTFARSTDISINISSNYTINEFHLDFLILDQVVASDLCMYDPRPIKKFHI
jgi:hypothetical protein